MARLYANENFPLPMVAEPRCLGNEVFTSVEMGQRGQELVDEQVLAWLCDGR
jgi:hypothetical protein